MDVKTALEEETRSRHHNPLWPPFTDKLIPLTKDALPLESQTIAWAISSGLALRSRPMVLRSSCLCSGVCGFIFFVMGVSTKLDYGISLIVDDFQLGFQLLRSFHSPWADTIDPNSMTTILHCVGFGQANHAMFGRSIGREIRKAEKASQRSHVDNGTFHFVL